MNVFATCSNSEYKLDKWAPDKFYAYIGGYFLFQK